MILRENVITTSNNVHFNAIITGGRGVEIFCFNSLSPFLSIVSIVSSQAILFQILLYAFFPRFPWSTLLPFPSYFKLDVLTDKMTITPQTALIYIFDHNINTQPIPKDISRHPTDQSHRTHYPDHAMLLPTQPQLIRDSKCSSFTTVQQIFPLCFKDKLCFPTNTYLHSLNFFHTLPILALTGSDAPP